MRRRGQRPPRGLPRRMSAGHGPRLAVGGECWNVDAAVLPGQPRDALGHDVGLFLGKRIIQRPDERDFHGAAQGTTISGSLLDYLDIDRDAPPRLGPRRAVTGLAAEFSRRQLQGGRDLLPHTVAAPALVPPP